MDEEFGELSQAEFSDEAILKRALDFYNYNSKKEGNKDIEVVKMSLKKTLTEKIESEKQGA